MNTHLGIVRPGSTIYFPFASYGKTNGESVTMSGLATSDIKVFKDGSTTERASASGFALLDTDGTDFDGLTGIHGFSIDLADNTTAGFWAAGSRYVVVVSSITVDSQTISFIAGTFTIGQPAAILNTTIATLASQTSFTLTAGPAEDDALNGMWVYIHDVASAVQCGWAVILDYTGSSKTVTLAAGTTFTAAASDNISIMAPSPLMPTVAARTLDVSSGGEAGVDWANVGTPGSTVNLSATTVKTATDVETDTADIQSRIPAALGANGNIKADVRDFNGTAGTFSAGRAEVNTSHVAGTAWASVDLTATMKTSVNTEVLDVMNTDTFAEPGQEAPGATVSLVKKIGYLYKAFRNKITQTSTQFKLFADDATTVDQKATTSDDGTTFTRGEVGTGP